MRSPQSVTKTLADWSTISTVETPNSLPCTLDKPSPDFEKEAQAVLTFQDGRHMKKMAANFDEKLDKIYVFVAV